MGRSRKTIRNRKYIKTTVIAKNGINFFKGQSNEKNAIGYCHYNIHKGYLTETLLKQHACIAKECPYLERYEYKTYWIKREIKKVVKKYRRHENKGVIMINDLSYKTDNEDSLLLFYRLALKETNVKPIIKYVAE